MSEVQLGDLGTWIGAVGTIAAVLFAWWSAYKETARRNKLEAAKQAEGISAWVIGGPPTAFDIAVSNTSGEPVYDLVVCIVLVQGAGPQNGKETFMQNPYKVLPPGQHTAQFSNYPGGGMHTKPGVEIAFTDKRGIHWLKDKNGKLYQIKGKNPASYYGLGLPIGWLYF